ncbi:hypothetical protein H6G96_39120 [Nostoc sp. FACHB-892]|nr:hypothetical protein [Nostoc sp. FACHB-892]
MASTRCQLGVMELEQALMYRGAFACLQENHLDIVLLVIGLEQVIQVWHSLPGATRATLAQESFLLWSRVVSGDGTQASTSYPG